MKNVLTYRLGNINDLQQLKELGLISYGQFSNTLTDENWDKMKNNINNEEALAALIKNSTTFVCECNNKIVGMAHLLSSGNPTHIYPVDWSYIRMVGVHPDHGGKGIATKLTQQCIDKAKQTNEKVIALHTSEIMDAARHVYEKLGFKLLKEIPAVFGLKYWVYKLDL